MLDIAYYLKFGFERWQLIAIEGLQKIVIKNKQTIGLVIKKTNEQNQTKTKKLVDSSSIVFF